MYFYIHICRAAESEPESESVGVGCFARSQSRSQRNLLTPTDSGQALIPDSKKSPCRSINPAVAGVFRHPRLAGGGGVKRPHVITRERMTAGRRTAWRSKAPDETVLMHPLNFRNEVPCQVKVRSKVKIGAFRLRAVETSKSSVLGHNLRQILRRNRGRY